MMLERDTAREKKIVIVLQMKLQHILAQIFKQSTEWAAKVTNTALIRMLQKKKFLWYNF